MRESDNQGLAPRGKVKPAIWGEALEQSAPRLLHQPTLYSFLRARQQTYMQSSFLENFKDHGSC